jgi:arylformamidase
MQVYGSYDQAGLDAQYDNRRKVPESGAIAERWMAAGAEARGLLSCDLDLGYGGHPRQAVESVDVPGGNHFTALEAFGDPHHPLCQAMLRLILAPSF